MNTEYIQKPFRKILYYLAILRKMLIAKLRTKHSVTDDVHYEKWKCC